MLLTCAQAEAPGLPCKLHNRCDCHSEACSPEPSLPEVVCGASGRKSYSMRQPHPGLPCLQMPALLHLSWQTEWDTVPGAEHEAVGISCSVMQQTFWCPHPGGPPS